MPEETVAGVANKRIFLFSLRNDFTVGPTISTKSKGRTPKMESIGSIIEAETLLHADTILVAPSFNNFSISKTVSAPNSSLVRPP